MILNLSAVPGVVKPRFIGSHGFTGERRLSLPSQGRRTLGVPLLRWRKLTGTRPKGNDERRRRRRRKRNLVKISLGRCNFAISPLMLKESSVDCAIFFIEPSPCITILSPLFVPRPSMPTKGLFTRCYGLCSMNTRSTFRQSNLFLILSDWVQLVRSRRFSACRDILKNRCIVRSEFLCVC